MAKKIAATEPVVTKKQFAKLLEVDAPRTVIFDIETGPLPDGELDFFLEEKKIKYPDEPGPFDASSITIPRNYTKAESKQKYLADARQRHQQDCAAYPQRRAEARLKALDALREESPLKAQTNVVLAIGYGILTSDGDIKVYLDRDEERNLTIRYASMLQRVFDTQGHVVTWNGDAFDIPVMQQKAWKYDIECPWLLTKYNKMDDHSIDGKVHFQMGNYQRAASLKHASQFFGVAGKVEDMDGSMFWKLLAQGNVEPAMRYLWHDIDATYRCCAKMGLLDGPLNILKQYAEDQKSRKKVS